MAQPQDKRLRKPYCSPAAMPFRVVSQPAYQKEQRFYKRDEWRNESECKEEVPMNAVFTDMLGIVEPLHAVESDESQKEQGQRRSW